MKLFATLGVALLAGCFSLKDNARYCDENTPCDDPGHPERSFCDLEGVYNADGIKNRCIEPPFDAGPTCSSSSECTEQTSPICDDVTFICQPCEEGTTGDTDCTAKDPGKPICAADGSCVAGCFESGDCPVSAPICSDERQCEPCDDAGTGDDDCEERDSALPRCTGDGTCVECLGDDDCDGATPVCEPESDACRACAQHSECASEVCDRDSGACVEPDNIVYVDDAAGADGPSCGTQGSPCATIAGAQGGLAKVTGTRTTVLVRPGTYIEAVVVNGGQTVALVGTGTVSPPLDSAGLAVSNGSDVSVEGLTVANASGNSDADGVRCTGSSSSVALLEMSVSDNDAIGVEVTDCALTIRRSKVSANQGGGISISNAPFTLVNNFIISNGKAGAGGTTFGGVQINNSSATSTQLLSFNTIADSLAQPTALSSGVFCTTSTAMTASNNIVYAGTGGQATLAGNCSWTYSDIDGGQAGTGNIAEPPLFVDAMNGDFHLEATSPCRNAADPDATLDVDYDGDARPEPVSGRRDIGADEVTPE